MHIRIHLTPKTSNELCLQHSCLLEQINLKLRPSEEIGSITLDNIGWIPGKMLIRFGGLGIHAILYLALTSYLSSRFSSLILCPKKSGKTSEDSNTIVGPLIDKILLHNRPADSNLQLSWDNV